MRIHQEKGRGRRVRSCLGSQVANVISSARAGPSKEKVERTGEYAVWEMDLTTLKEVSVTLFNRC